MGLIKSIALISCLLIFTCFSSCDYVKYSKAIKEETITKFNTNKEFIQRISFSGYIIEKNIVYDCQNIYKYRVKLHLNKLTETPNIGNIQFNPYYSFENDSIVTISVSKDLYNNINVRSKLSKKNNSTDITIDNKLFKYLSNEKDKWLP
jgi:hypothetical protein